MKPIRNCAKAIIIRNDRILAVKYDDEEGEYYALPGGAQYPGETLPEALVRECQEELGITVNNLGLRFIREYIGKNHESSKRDAEVHQLEFIYECEIGHNDHPTMGKHSDHSQVDIEWIPLSDISSYRFYPKTLTKYLGQKLKKTIQYWGDVD